MSSNLFVQEIAAFIKLHRPLSSLVIQEDFAVLNFESNGKSIGIIGNSNLEKMKELTCNYYLTEFQWNKNMEAAQSRLCSLLGATQRIHGRQCVLKSISKSEAKKFVDMNHTMGYAEAHFNYGLLLRNELVAVACFSKGRRMNRLPEHKKSFELIRFCSKNYFTVVGGLGKFIRHFEEEQHPGDIMTYVDRNWGEPHAYFGLGFMLDKISEPVTLNIKDSSKNEIEFTNQGNYKLIKHLV